jgi:hypothetical protein
MDVNDPASVHALFRAPGDASSTDQEEGGEAILLDQHRDTDDIMIAERDSSWRISAYEGGSTDDWSGMFFDSGKYVLYATDVAGKVQIAADHFPVPTQRVILTHDGIGLPNDVRAFWVAGRQLVYLAQDGKTLRCSTLLATPSGLVAGPAISLFTLPDDYRGIRPDAQAGRFLLETPEGPRQHPSVVLIQNWDLLRSHR